MKIPRQSRPKLTDAERYRRFLDMAEKAQASESKMDLDTAILKAAHQPTLRPNHLDETARPKQSIRPTNRKDNS